MKSSKYSSKESLIAPQVNVDAPSTSGNQSRGTPPPPAPRVLASSMKSSKYSSKESLIAPQVNVDAPSKSGNQFQRRPSVSSISSVSSVSSVSTGSSVHFGAEEQGLSSSQYSSKESLTTPVVNVDAPSTSGNQFRGTPPAKRVVASSMKSSKYSSKESLTTIPVNVDAPSRSGNQFQRKPSVSSSSSGHFGGEEPELKSSQKYSKYSSKESLIATEVNGDATSTSGNQFQRRPSGAENLVPINSGGRNVDLSSEQPKSGQVQEMKQLWARKTASRSSSVGHGFSPVTSRFPSIESLTDIHGRVGNMVSKWGDNINKNRKPASSKKYEASISSASKHEEKEPEQPLSGKGSVSRRGSVSGRHQHQQSQAENGASLKNPSFSLRDSENRSSCSSTSSGTSTPTLSRCNTLDKAVDALSKSITLVKSYAKPQRSMTYSDSSDSRTSRASSVSSVSSVSSISNPGKASNASNAGKASSTSYSSKRRDSFLSVNQPKSDASSDSEAGKSRSTGKASSTSYSSKRQEKSFHSVNQPTSGASYDSEAGKSSSTGKAGKASSTSYSSKRKEESFLSVNQPKSDASSDSAAALEKGNFTWFRKFKSSKGFVKN